ncbi:hypothetical protein CIB48_g1241 [Xylaria polymorpha]|nr:hypothetical protein CIB48_g1241 [Xylaria polymorpha]
MLSPRQICLGLARGEEGWKRNTRDSDCAQCCPSAGWRRHIPLARDANRAGQPVDDAHSPDGEDAHGWRGDDDGVWNSRGPSNSHWDNNNYSTAPMRTQPWRARGGSMRGERVQITETKASGVVRSAEDQCFNSTYLGRK